MKITKFQDLEIWQLAIDLVILVYKLSNGVKFTRDFGLRDQVRRAVVSIVSNIAEGFEMNNNNDFIRFLRIAKGSTGEVKTQLIIAWRLNYISEAEFKDVLAKLDMLSLKIGKFISYLLSKRKNKEFTTR
ncbi:hypothetical protein A3A74_05430 [Candidatus Roizmanbacteria bacterium RIFCSPLOWO2_01_FULL_35_13]|uniref:Four helix bundle protein n=1 Tax=Candidatus Roizmanbacteria bacterium RIFCSPLOWO2_01_FULL_35_13 TaxID=1802055 RepID=A0A1F7I948_9BACT|nr:MAG: hypothetical protein A3A74_05430 [Candidatus Roizmanbacteria bacterium RIFCSPLOWO2_01_FULL_35_13]